MKKNFLWSLLAVAALCSACSSNEKKQEPAGQKKDTSVSKSDIQVMDTSGFQAPVSQTTVAADSLRLLFNMPKGKPFRYVMDMKMEGKAEERTMQNTTKGTYDLVVIRESKKVKTVKGTYRQFAVSMNMGGMKMDFDSEKEVTGTSLFDLPPRIFRAMKDKSFTMDVNEKGEIIKVEGFEAIAEAIVKEVEVPEAQKQMLQQSFRKQFNEDGVKEIFALTFGILPDKAVKVGDKWTQKSGNGKGPADMVTTYTVRNIKDGKVYLDVASKMISTDASVGGSQTGKMIVDAATGMVTDANISIKMSGKRTATGTSRVTSRAL